MAFTNRSEIYGAIHKEGINFLLRHVMRQRPSLFTYATTYVAEKRPELLCQRVEVSEMVRKYNNPVASITEPLPLVPIDKYLALNFCLQVTDLEIDFHPGGVFDLPSELGDLSEQRFALRGQACAGLGCPPQAFLDEFTPPTEDQDPPREPVVPDVDELICFCLQLFVMGHFESVTVTDTLETMLKPRLDGIELVDMEPRGLENSVECYIRVLVQVVLLPRLSQAIGRVVPSILKRLDDELGLTLVPAPTSGSLSHNPAIAEDQLQLFINIEEVSG
jgi:hypothetical protein